MDDELQVVQVELGAALENFLAPKQKSFGSMYARKNKVLYHKKTRPPKHRPTIQLPISAFDDGRQYQRPGQYYAILTLLTPGFSDVVARWHGLCVPLSCKKPGVGDANIA